MGPGGSARLKHPESSPHIMERMIDVIRRRRSVRTFSPEPLNPEHRDVIECVIGSSVDSKAPFGTVPRIIHMDAGDDDPPRIGTYGVIKGPKGYLVGICENRREGEIDLGYVMENIVLRLTGMGIGTCWLGGTFKKTQIKDIIDLRENEVVAALIPYGYPADRGRLVERLMKMAAGSSQRKPIDELFDRTEVMDESLTECLEGVRLAPSSLNNQPWRGRVESDRVHLCMELPKKQDDTLMRMRHLDMGIAMQHLEAVCNENFGDAVWTWGKAPFHIDAGSREYIATLVFQPS